MLKVSRDGPETAKSADFFRPPSAADDFLPENHGKLEIFPAAYGGEQNFQVEITMESKIGPEKNWPPEAAEKLQILPVRAKSLPHVWAFCAKS